MWEQIILVLVSISGLPLVWLPKNIERRIKAVAGLSGIVVFILSWVLLPIVSQPRASGFLALGLTMLGVFFFALGLAISWLAYRTIHRVVGWGHDGPVRLVKEGVYSFVRHPIYSGLMSGLLGWSLIWKGVYAILLTPVLYTLLRLESWMEEEVTLKKRFAEEYEAYQREVPAFFPDTVAILLLGLAAFFSVSIYLGWIPFG